MVQLLLTLTLLAPCAVALAPAMEDEEAKPVPLAILVNRSNSAADLSLIDLREIMNGERRFWSGSDPVTILMREKGSDERRAVLDKVYEMDEKDYSKYWLKQVYRGKAIAPPKILASEKEMTEAIRNDPSAIGYARVAEAPEGMKILSIDNKMPLDKDYLFAQSE